MNSPYRRDFSMDPALARRLGRPAPAWSVTREVDRFINRLDGAAAAVFTATALFAGVVIFASLEAVYSAAAAPAWLLAALMASSSTVLILFWRSARERNLRMEGEIEILREEAERARRQMRGEAAFFGGSYDDVRR